MVLGKVVAHEMQLQHYAYCMKEIWNTTIKSVCYVDYEKAFDRLDCTVCCIGVKNLMKFLGLPFAASGIAVKQTERDCYCSLLMLYCRTILYTEEGRLSGQLP